VVNLVALNAQTHRTLRIATERSLNEYSQVNVVSVVPREFPRLLAHYPIFFTKGADNGQFEPAVLLGFVRNENLFLVDGKWDATYVPIQVQRYPFSLLPRQIDTPTGKQNTLDVAFDSDSPHLQSETGERLFADDGQPTQYTQTVTSMLSALVGGSREAYGFTGRLAELNLLEPVSVKVEFVDRSETNLQGLYWIAAKTLKELPAAQLAELRDREYLEWMYFQMASLSHMASLVARKNKRLSSATPPNGVEAPGAGSG
jgi:hypothetical protein